MIRRLNKFILLWDKLNNVLFSDIMAHIALSFVFIIFAYAILLHPVNESEINAVIDGDIIIDTYNISNENMYWFYYDFLTDAEKEIYSDIYNGIIDMKQEIYVKPISFDDIKKIYYCIVFDNPQLIYLSDEFSCKRDEDDNVLFFTPQYTLEKGMIENRMSAINAEIKDIEEKTKNMSDYDKELYAHDYLLRRCSYTEDKDADKTIYGAIIKGKTNCRGYSAAFSYILNRCGIKSGQVIGNVARNGKKEGHSWNFVILDGEFYYCDECWNDINNDASDYVPYHYSFFNMDYDEMKASHNMEEQEKYLFKIVENNTGKYSYLKNNGLYASDKEQAYDIILSNIYITKMLKKPLMLQCSTNELYVQVSDNLDDMMKKIINESDSGITHCQYLKIPDGNTIIIYNLS